MKEKLNLKISVNGMDEMISKIGLLNEKAAELVVLTEEVKSAAISLSIELQE